MSLELYLEPSRTSTMELFCELQKSYTVDVLQGSKYTFGAPRNSHWQKFSRRSLLK